MNRQFGPLIWAFNLLPSAWCHAGWLPPGIDDSTLRDRSATDNPCHRYLSPWLLQTRSLAADFEFTFADRLTRTVLFDEAALARLATLLGVLLRRELLRRVIDGAALASIRSAVGMKEIGFVASSVESFRLDVPGAMTGVPSGDVGAQLQRDGALLLMHLLGTSPRAVIGRMQLRFAPAAEARAPRFCSADDAARAKAWIVDQLVPRMLPSWTPLFC